MFYISLPTKHEIFVWVTVTFLTCSTCEIQQYDTICISCVSYMYIPILRIYIYTYLFIYLLIYFFIYQFIIISLIYSVHCADVFKRPLPDFRTPRSPCF